MKTYRNLFAATILVAMFTACATLGMPTPKSFNERAASGYTTVTTVAQTTTSLLRAKVISVADAENVEKQATTAKEGLDIARSLHGSVPTAADQRLEASLVILQALQKYLAERGGK